MKMSFNLKLNVLGVLVIFQCYVAISGDVIYDVPPNTAPGSTPLKTASYIIQQVTTRIHYVGELYYFRRIDEMLYYNRKKNGTVNTWNVETGKEEVLYNEVFSNETVATVSPIKQNKNQYLVGSNQNLRIFTKTSTGFSASDILIQFNNAGFIIYSSHCDRNGNMFILLVGDNMDNSHLGKLYKIENRKAVFVMDFDTKPGDFRFNVQSTALYMVNDHGKKVTKFNYDINTKELGDATEVFDLSIYPELKHHIMKSVVVDRKNEHLWATASGTEGYVIEIDPFNKSLDTVISVPSKDLTCIVFANEQYQTIYVGSKTTCTKGKAQGAIYAIAGTGAMGLTDIPIDW